MLAIFGGVVHFSSAAIDIGGDDIVVTVSPQSPHGYQDTTITLSSYATNLSLASIEWKKDGTPVLSGFGKTTYSFKTGASGTPIRVTITIALSEGIQLSKEILITPSDLDIFWEARDSYTPPFYKGKALPSSEAVIKVVAIPAQTKSTLSYSWKQNSSSIPQSSGYKKNTLLVVNDILQSAETVSVDVASSDGAYGASANVVIPIVSPDLEFYTKTADQGILYAQVLGSETTLEGDDLSIVAEPYFLNLYDKKMAYNYQWKINDQDITTPVERNELTIQPNSRGGYTLVGLLVEESNSLFQKISRVLRVNF